MALLVRWLLCAYATEEEDRGEFGRGREKPQLGSLALSSDFLVILNCCSVGCCSYTLLLNRSLQVECRTHLIHNTKRALMSFRFCGCVCPWSIQSTTTAAANTRIYTSTCAYTRATEKWIVKKITYTTGIVSWGAHCSRACRADNTSLKYCSNNITYAFFAFIRSFSPCLSSTPSEIRELQNAMVIQQRAKRA